MSETAKFAHVVLSGASGANARFSFIESDPAGECGNSSEFVPALQANPFGGERQTVLRVFCRQFLHCGLARCGQVGDSAEAPVKPPWRRA